MEELSELVHMSQVAQKGVKQRQTKTFETSMRRLDPLISGHSVNNDRFWATDR
jgi:hypothetical protein